MRLGLALLASSVCVVLPAQAQRRAEAPVAIAVPEGRWIAREGLATGTGERRPSLSFEAAVFPRVSLSLFRVECGGLSQEFRFEVVGLLPEQSFPQPEISIELDGERWSAFPNARYFKRSQPADLGNRRMQGQAAPRTISWPGHPPYAELAFTLARHDIFMPSLLSKGPVRIRFAGQERSFPPAPEALTEVFARACAEPPAIRAPRR